MKFPKTIAVKWDGEGDERYLAAFNTVEDTANMGTVETVALYRLEHVLKVTTEVNVRPVGKRG